MSYFGVLRRYFVPWMVALSLLYYLPDLALADASSASLSITVSDTSGAIITDATAILRNSDTNQQQTSVSTKSGNASFPFLKPGHYALTVSKDGFSDVSVNNILLNVGDDKHLQLVLKVGAANQNVIVDGSGATINTTDGSVSTVIDRQFVENIPLNGRSFQDLISMTPGVTTNSPQTLYQSPGGNGDFSINGQRSESNYYIVDGVAGNINAGNAQTPGVQPAAGGIVAASSTLGTTQSLLSVDALQEFRVESSSYSAEYGRSPGGQLTFITRSGTNRYHGTAFDYLRNGWFDANDWFNDNVGAPKQALRQNDFGGTVGGPVWLPHFYIGTNKTFFFGSYEGLRLTQPTAATVQYVPDIYMRQQAPAAIQPILSAFPVQSPNGIDYGSSLSPSLAQFIQGYSTPGQIDSTSVRVDQTLNTKLSAFFRFADTPSSVQSRVLSVLTSAQNDTKTYTFGTTYSPLFNMTNQFRLGYAKGTSSTSDSLDGFGGAAPLDLGNALGNTSGVTGRTLSAIALIYLPSAGISELQSSVGANDQNQWNIVDTVYIAHGIQHFKIGVDYRRISTLSSQPPLIEGLYESAAQVLANVTHEAALYKYAPATPTFNQFAAFIQDDLKINARLNLSGGLRWELSPPPHTALSPQPFTVLGDVNQPSTLTLAPAGTPLWRTSWYNFAPRLGLAWQIHNSRGSETVIRVGSGVFYDTSNEAATVSFNALGFSSYKVYRSVPLPMTAAQQDFSITVAPPYTAVAAYPSHQQLPYTEQWNLSLEQALGANQTLSLSYVGSAGRRISTFQQLSVGSLSSLFTTVDDFSSSSTSDYDGLQVKFQRHVTRGLNALISYTWSHSLDDGSTYNTFPVVRGNSDFDLRHNFQAGLVWDLPEMSVSDAAARLLRGWHLDSRLLARTGFPVGLEGNYLTDPNTGSEYYTSVDLTPGVPLYLYGSQYPGGRALNGGPNATNPAFTLPSGNDYGNAPRNVVRGFGEFQVNSALQRTFNLSEALRLQFRAEAFNIFNHPNFGYIDPSLTDPTFGQALQMLDESLGTVASQYQQGGPRSMQFALKLSF